MISIMMRDAGRITREASQAPAGEEGKKRDGGAGEGVENMRRAGTNVPWRTWRKELMRLQVGTQIAGTSTSDWTFDEREKPQSYS